MAEAIHSTTPFVDFLVKTRRLEDRKHKKVTLVIRLLANRSGGAERIFIELGNMLSAQGYEVSCVYHEANRSEPFYPIAPSVLAMNLAPARPSRTQRILAWLGRRTWLPGIGHICQWLADYGSFVRRLRRHIASFQPDIIISFLPSANTLTLVSALGTGVPVIITNHNVPWHDYVSKVRWDQNPVDRWLRRFMLQFASRIHVIFPGFAEWFPKRLGKKMVVVPNYISSSLMARRPETISEDNRENIILAVGRLSGVKAYDRLIRAWAGIHDKYPGWKVWICGDGPQHNSWSRLAKELGIEDSVTFLGRRSDVDVLYRRARIFCHPAEHEGFGLSVAEALAFGLPVVAFRTCDGVNEFVFHGKNGLLAENSDESLAENIEKLIVDTSFRFKMMQAAHGSVDCFSEELFAKNFDRIIMDVLER